MSGSFTSAERLRLLGLAAAVGGLNLVGWGLFAWYSGQSVALAGLGTLAFAFGLRHAFDADHIAAIDNTTRKLLQDGRRPLATGFFFSLGHSTVVLGLVCGLALATTSVDARLPVLQRYGGAVGAGVSGAFLWLIGVLNLLVLVDVVRIARELRTRGHDGGRLERRLLDRGLMSRLFLGRLSRRIRSSRQLYPLGLLFGLGFDTASEIGLLALSSGVATSRVPLPAVLSLPILFAAGMSLVDSADGVFMSRAYGWAFASPARRVYYNLVVTALSVGVALVVGTVELLQVARVPGFGGVDLGAVGYGIVAALAAAWAVSLLVWRTSRIEERWSRSLH